MMLCVLHSRVAAVVAVVTAAVVAMAATAVVAVAIDFCRNSV